MDAYITFFAAFALVVILYYMCYNQFIFKPRVKLLNAVSEFRYARNLNNDLIYQLDRYSADLRNASSLLNGLGYDAVMEKLQTWRDKFYTDDQLNKLKQNKPGKLDSLLADINQQIKTQHIVKDTYKQVLKHRGSIAA